jgi:hypothetical protein
MCECEEKAKRYVESILGGPPMVVDSSYVDRLIESHRNQRDIIRGGSEQAQTAAKRQRFIPWFIRKWLMGA